MAPAPDDQTRSNAKGQAYERKFHSGICSANANLQCDRRKVQADQQHGILVRLSALIHCSTNDAPSPTGICGTLLQLVILMNSRQRTDGLSGPKTTGARPKSSSQSPPTTRIKPSTPARCTVSCLTSVTYAKQSNRNSGAVRLRKATLDGNA